MISSTQRSIVLLLFTSSTGLFWAPCLCLCGENGLPKHSNQTLFPCRFFATAFTYLFPQDRETLHPFYILLTISVTSLTFNPFAAGFDLYHKFYIKVPLLQFEFSSTNFFIYIHCFHLDNKAGTTIGLLIGYRLWRKKSVFLIYYEPQSQLPLEGLAHVRPLTCPRRTHWFLEEIPNPESNPEHSFKSHCCRVAIALISVP